MKKLITLFIALTLVMNVQAQIKLGVKAGLNLNDMSFNKETSLNDIAKNRTGWHIGMALKANLPFGLTIQPELLYSTKGINNLPDLANIGKNTDYVFNYLEIPINLQWGISLGQVRPFVVCAPYFSYLIDSRSPIDEPSNWDGGIGLGAGIDLWKVQLMVKHVWGMGNVATIKGISGVQEVNLQNRTTVLSLGFFL